MYVFNIMLPWTRAWNSLSEEFNICLRLDLEEQIVAAIFEKSACSKSFNNQSFEILFHI